MKAILAVAGLLLCGLGVPGGVPGAAAQTVRFPSVAVGNVPAGPEITGWLYRPPGTAGPAPALVLAHPCNGVTNHTRTWGQLLAGWGYVTLAPDSFGPRGEKNVCGRGRAVSGQMRVADVAGAIDWLNAQPFVAKGRIGLIGHSHGGGTTMRAVQAGFGLVQRGLRAAVAYYPSCSAKFDRNVDVPTLILIGDKDDWTPADDCRHLQAAGFARPALVEVVYYPNAFHSFDNKAVGDRTITVADGKSHRLVYDPVGGPDAEARTRAFFDKYLKQ
jgi:dienelactone hydrolase